METTPNQPAQNGPSRLGPLVLGLGLLGALLAASVAGFSFYFKTKNQIVSWDVQVDSAWAQVENVLQRRMDLIPSLVETVKGFAKHEKGVIDSITEARAAYIGAKTPLDKMQASDRMESAISRLLVFTENYPQLKADALFIRLTDELAGTENRISVERMRYNGAVEVFNTKIQQFPYSFFTGGRTLKPFFKAKTGADTPPTVKF